MFIYSELFGEKLIFAIVARSTVRNSTVPEEATSSSMKLYKPKSVRQRQHSISWVGSETLALNLRKISA